MTHAEAMPVDVAERVLRLLDEMPLWVQGKTFEPSSAERLRRALSA
jgi:hypothetical protein